MAKKLYVWICGEQQNENLTGPGYKLDIIIKSCGAKQFELYQLIENFNFRIAKATGATFCTSLANLEGEESFEVSMLGEAAEVWNIFLFIAILIHN